MNREAGEFLGLNEIEARARAGALGWAFRDHADPGWWFDDACGDRIDVWFGDHSVVVAAEVG